MNKSAVISACGMYRYYLWRQWGTSGKGYATFIGLNPSTADDKLDDATIRRCMKFSQDWGYDALCMVNLFAFRTTFPEELKRFKGDPVGPDNNSYLLSVIAGSAVTVAAWGTDGGYMERDRAVRIILSQRVLHYLRLTKDGYPGHPLYLPKTLKPVLWV